MKVGVNWQVKQAFTEREVEQVAAALVSRWEVTEPNLGLEAQLLGAKVGDFVLIGHKEMQVKRGEKNFL